MKKYLTLLICLFPVISAFCQQYFNPNPSTATVTADQTNSFLAQIPEVDIKVKFYNLSKPVVQTILIVQSKAGNSIADRKFNYGWVLPNERLKSFPAFSNTRYGYIACDTRSSGIEAVALSLHFLRADEKNSLTDAKWLTIVFGGSGDLSSISKEADVIYKTLTNKSFHDLGLDFGATVTLEAKKAEMAEIKPPMAEKIITPLKESKAPETSNPSTPTKETIAENFIKGNSENQKIEEEEPEHKQIEGLIDLKTETVPEPASPTKPNESSNAKSNNDCQQKLNKILSQNGTKTELKDLKKLAKKYPDCLPLNLALGNSYLNGQSEADEDWLKLGLESYQKAYNADATNSEAQWGLAFLWEYSGNYNWAIPFYKQLLKKAEDESNTKKVQEIKAHLITCQFLQKNNSVAVANNKANEEVDKKSSLLSIDSTDFSKEGVLKKTGWIFLKELTAAVSVIAGEKLPEKERRYVQVALDNLYEWLDAPKNQKVEVRNRLLAGLVSTITTMIIEEKLGAQLTVPRIVDRIGKLEELPEKNFASNMDVEFKQQQPEEGKSYKISDNLTIEVKWEVPNIGGTWLVETSSPTSHCSKNLCLTGNPIQIIIAQTGKSIRVICESCRYPPIPGTVSFDGIVNSINDIKLVQSFSSSFAIEKAEYNLRLKSNDILEGTADSYRTNHPCPHSCTWVTRLTKIN